MTAGGAAGVATIDEVSNGDALGASNSQEFAFQFGVNVDQGSAIFTAHTRILSPFAGLAPQDSQSMGLFVGNGDQDNYFKIVVSSNGGLGGINAGVEIGGLNTNLYTSNENMPGPGSVDLYLTVNPAAATIQARYTVTNSGTTGPITDLGVPQSIPPAWLNSATKLAVGIISTSAGSAPVFPATWDFVEVTPDVASVSGWGTAAVLPIKLGEVAGGIIGNKMFMIGEGNDATLAYDFTAGTWTSPGTLSPRIFTGHHHAAEVFNGKLYLIGGLHDGSDGKVQIYDPVADSWTTGATAPFLAGSSATAIIGGKIYFAGGIIGSATTNKVAVYDLAQNSWSATLLAPMPQGVNHAAAATDGSKLYVFGGRDGGNSVSNGFNYLQIYDPVTNTWESSEDAGSTLLPLPQARGGMGKAVLHAGELYVIGGETTNGPGATADRVYNRVDIYNPVTKTWRLGNAMPTARHGIFPLLRSGKIYVAGGGVKAGNSQSTVFETYNPD
jgi:N-acetylneuraminic acid mutarotase